MTTDPLAALGGLILWIAERQERGSSSGFRAEALARLGEQVSFDRAIWADATVVDGMKLRSAELFNIPDAAKADFERAASADPRMGQVLAGAGVSHAYSVLEDDPEDYRALVAHIDVGHIMSTGQFDPIMNMVTGMVLFAPPGRAPFDEAERRFVQAAYPHLMAGWRQCQISEILRLARGDDAPRTFSAVTQGPMINAADVELPLLLRKEWPEWRGPHLPADLLDPLSGAPREIYLGRSIVVRARHAVDTALVTVRERSAVDDLTARERSVADLCGQGLAYKDIAARLGISPATARNHIAAVHRRLGIKRNSEIARLLAAAG